MRIWNIAFRLVIVVSFSAVCHSNASEPAHKEAIAKFKGLQEEFKARHELYWQLAKHANEEHREKMYEAMYPSETMVLQFLLLEERNRGNQVGLSCLHQLLSRGRGEELSKYVSARGKQIALQRLAGHYAEDSDLDLVLWWTDGASELDEETERLLQIAKKSPHAHVRAAAFYITAKNLKERGLDHELIRGILFLLDEAGNERTETQSGYFELLRGVYDSLYRGRDAQSAQKNALQNLDELVADYAKTPSVPRGGPGPILVERERISDPQQQPTYGELAERMRFELTRLAIGQIAPDIDQPDAFGRPLKLYDHRDKVTVVFFSFKGCGPCETMYPELRDLVEEMKGRPFVMLGVMGDQGVETVHEAVENGKITWPVWWSGSKREISNQWNVRGWPTIYVIDHTGTIRYKDLRFGLLTRAVRKLVAEAEAAE